MIFDSEEPDRPLSAAEEELVATLSAADQAAIDEALLEAAGERWCKVAFLVARALQARESRWPLLPDVYYGARLRVLVEGGVVEGRGDPRRMRFCEVRRRAG